GDVAALQELARALVAGPFETAAVEHVVLVGDAHARARVGGREHEPLDPAPRRRAPVLPRGQRLRLERGHGQMRCRSAATLPAVEAQEVVADRLLGRALDRGVERRAYLQAAVVERDRALALLEAAAHLLGEELAQLLLGLLLDDDERLLDRRVV